MIYFLSLKTFPQKRHLENWIFGRVEASCEDFKPMTLTLPQLGQAESLFTGRLGKSTFVSLTFFLQKNILPITLNFLRHFLHSSMEVIESHVLQLSVGIVYEMVLINPLHQTLF